MSLVPDLVSGLGQTEAALFRWLAAVLGFSWGGSIAFPYEMAAPDVQAAVIYYGRAPTQPAEYKFVKTPLLGWSRFASASTTANYRVS